MARNWRLLIGGVALVVVTAFICTQAQSQEKDKDKAAKKPEAGQAQAPSPDEIKDMMDKYKELNAPGPQHKQFAKAVGKWDAVSRMWTDPSAPPTESKGQAEYRLACGGRYLISNYKGDMMKEPFEGMGIDGYDNFRQEYTSIWIDNFSTAILNLTGHADETGKIITFTGKMDEPLTKERDKPLKTILRWVNDDKFVFEWYDLAPDGKETKIMEIEYTRAK